MVVVLAGFELGEDPAMVRVGGASWAESGAMATTNATTAKRERRENIHERR